MGTRESTPLTILVVDDVEEVRDALEKLLTDGGYRVEAARSEDRAVDSAQRTPPHLVLMNMQATRDELVAMGLRIRARSGLPRTVPVVLFSVEWVRAGEEVELHDHLFAIDPDNFDQLRMLIARLLRGGSS